MNEIPEAFEALRAEFRRMVEAGVQLSSAEWCEMGTAAQNLWLLERQAYHDRNLALQSRVLASALYGGSLAEDLVYDELGEEAQDAILMERAHDAEMVARLSTPVQAGGAGRAE